MSVIENSLPPAFQHAVMAIGGAEDKIRHRHILRTFFQRSGGPDAIIVVIPSASREPEAMGQVYKDIFTEMGAKQVDVLLVVDRLQAEDPVLLAILKQATGVFLSGGDQLRLCALLDDTPLMTLLQAQVKQEAIVLAGTSAGAAVLSTEMIACGGSGEPPNRGLVDLTTGLGFIPDVIVDQHFHNRNRLARLISAIAAYPDKLGVGVDEDTCAMFEANGTINVLGKGAVTIVDSTEVKVLNHTTVEENSPLSIANLRLHVLSQGDCYDLHTRQVKTPLKGLPTG
jgi:cyanophycinase